MARPENGSHILAPFGYSLANSVLSSLLLVS